MSEKSSPAKNVFFFGVDQVFSYVFSWAIGLPIVAGTVTAVSGFLQDQPLWVMIPATGLAVMTVVMIVNHVDMFMQRRSVKDKVKLAGLQFGPAISPAENNATGYTVALMLENMSDAPVEYVVEAFEAVMGDTKSREGLMPTSRFTIPPKHVQSFKSGLIATGIMADQIVSLTVNGRLKYGRAGGPLRHTLTPNQTLVAQLNNEGGVSVGDMYSGDMSRDGDLIRALRAQQKSVPAPITIAVENKTTPEAM